MLFFGCCWKLWKCLNDTAEEFDLASALRYEHHQFYSASSAKEWHLRKGTCLFFYFEAGKPSAFRQHYSDSKMRLHWHLQQRHCNSCISSSVRQLAFRVSEERKICKTWTLQQWLEHNLSNPITVLNGPQRKIDTGTHRHTEMKGGNLSLCVWEKCGRQKEWEEDMKGREMHERY